MQMDRNEMKVDKSVSMHSHTLELPCKRQIVTDTKSSNASHIWKACLAFSLIQELFLRNDVCYILQYPFSGILTRKECIWVISSEIIRI